MSMYLCIKINLPWFRKVKVRHKIIKLLEENINENLYDLGFSKKFLDMPIKVLMGKKGTNLEFKKLKLLLCERHW